jgi:integrase/recombinase XerD
MTDAVAFQSILSCPIQGYIDEKKAVGYKFQKGTAMLKRFDIFVRSWNPADICMPKELVLDWTKRTPNETISNQCQRISLLRGLAEYMNRIGYSAYVYPRALVTIDRYSYIPYIFSEEEMHAIFNVCDCYPKTKTSPYRHLILTLIIRMLYGCGLRISEAVNLTVDDVDLNKGTIFITGTKFGKERLIPMSVSLNKRCRNYTMTVLAGKTGDYPFFPSPHGGHYSSSTIYSLFRKVLWKAGISHSGKGPRLHDMRHTFAVHCLKKWVLEGRDLSNCLPYLSVYLGHEDMRGSQRYLRLTADLYPDITAKVEQTCSWLIPEVHHETD